ncbi:MAG: hypothetical protein GVY20_09180 [Bacteroidetes bacterium]|nr:hypothetical protein [Bacteroidota bacterium]
MQKISQKRPTCKTVGRNPKAMWESRHVYGYLKTTSQMTTEPNGKSQSVRNRLVPNGTQGGVRGQIGN